MTAMILSALLIFILRVIDITLATLRMLMVIRGRKSLAWLSGFFQAIVFVIAIRAILTDMGNYLNLIGYAAGFATGGVLGMLIEERMAIGYILLNIISPRRGPAIADQIRAEGFAVTEIPARGRDGSVALLNCSVRRKKVHQVEALVKAIDPEAFITAEELRPVWRGYWGH